MKKWIEKLKKKDGWVTLVVIFVLSTMLPIFLFFFVEMNYLYGVKDKAQYIADDMSSSAVRSLSQLKLNGGKVEIDPIEATEVANELLKENYDLNDDFSLKQDSMLREAPIVKTYVINPSSNSGESFTTDEGYTYTIYEPTVIVYTSIKPKGVFFNRLVNIQTLSMHVIKKINTQANNSSSPSTPTEPVIVRYTIPSPDISHIPDQGTFTGKRTITVGGVVYFDGRFANGKFDKQGQLYDVNGKIVYDGTWLNGVYDGNGIVYNPNGTKFYEGSTLNGVPNGNGTYYGEDGIEDYKGQFEDGYRQGFGNTNNGNNNGNNSVTADKLIFEKIYFDE